MIPPDLHTGPSKLGVIILSSNKAIELPWAPHSKGWSPDNLTSHCLGIPRARLVRTDLGVLRSDLVFRLTFKTKHSAGPCLALLGIQQQWKPHFPLPPMRYQEANDRSPAAAHAWPAKSAVAQHIENMINTFSTKKTKQWWSLWKNAQHLPLIIHCDTRKR